MLRNALLAGAAALALLPGIGSAQSTAQSAARTSDRSSPSDTAGVATPGGSTTPYSSPVPGSSDTAAPAAESSSGDDQPPAASQAPDTSGPDANRAAGYYTSGSTDQPAPDASGQTPPNPGAAGMDANRSGSAYTAQPPAAAQPSAPAAQPQASASMTTANAGPLNSDQPVVVVARQSVEARQYVRRAAMGDNYEIRAGQIALKRAQSDAVRQFANDMIQQHGQSTAILTQAANQANVPVDSSLDRSHQAMLRRLERVRAGDFDRVYMNQQLTAHMNAASLHQGYAQNGDNPTLQQAAQQISPVVQQHLNLAWADSGVPQRLAEQRNNELSQLAEASPRGSTYRGYTVIGPRSAKQLHEASRTVGATGYSDQYTTAGGTGSAGAAGMGQSGAATVGTPQYQGYSSSQSYSAGQGYTPGAAPPGTATPGTPGTTNPNLTGTPPSPGYASPGATQPSTGAAAPGTATGTTNPNATGTPQYQGYTSGTPGSAAPGQYPSATTPGTASPSAPSTTTPGATSPGYPSTAAPGTTTPGAPATGATTPGANPPGAASPGSATPPPGAAGPG